jgi:hypothetical protein
MGHRQTIASFQQSISELKQDDLDLLLYFEPFRTLCLSKLSSAFNVTWLASLFLFVALTVSWFAL